MPPCAPEGELYRSKEFSEDCQRILFQHFIPVNSCNLSADRPVRFN
jgi:hypothetical protein